MNIKRIIVREGLILIVTILLGVVISKFSEVFDSWIMTKFYPHAFFTPYSSQSLLIYRLGMLILYFGYPAYLLIRFILWAIRILRKK
jgi:hypothetical protein